MNRSALRILCVAIAAALIGDTASAEDGRGVRIGPFRAVPTVGLTVSRESNVLRSSRNEIDSLLTVLSPGLQLERGDESSGVLFGYEGEYGRYSKSEVRSENFRNHKAYAEFRAAPTARTRFNGIASYTRGQDFRGETGAQQGQFVQLAQSPDRYRRLDGRLGAEYGAEGARGLLAGGITYADVAYRNNREFTQFRDYTETGFDALFGWRIAPKTRLTLSAARRNIDFDRVRELRDVFGNTSRFASFDSRETDFLIGLSLDATAKTSGRIAFGRVKKDFDDPSFDDFSGNGWQAGISWRPVTYSTIDLSAVRETSESDLVQFGNLGFDSSFLVATSYTLAWSHSWTDRFKTSLDGGFGDDSYRAITSSGVELRQHDLRFWGVGMDYQFRTWLQFGAGFKHYERDSTDALFDYRRNVWTLSLEGTLE